MRNSELAQVLRAANPWWSRRRRASWVLDDPELTGRARHEWAPATRSARTELAHLAQQPLPGTLTLVVGPRSVGKTTAVKDVVASLVADPTLDPRRVVLVPVQRARGAAPPDCLTADELSTVLRSPTRTGAPATDDPRVLVVDEVGAVPGWTEMLLAACRRGDQVVATSSVLDPEDLAHLLTPDVPHTVRHLRPASLSEVLLESRAGAHPAEAEQIRADFLRHGGLPRALAEHRDLGDVSTETATALATGLHEDVCRGEEVCPIDRLLAAVCATTDRFVEPGRLARELELPPARVRMLLGRLQSAHVLDPHRGLVDPLLHRLPSLLAPERHAAPPTEHVAACSA